MDESHPEDKMTKERRERTDIPQRGRRRKMHKTLQRSFALFLTVCCLLSYFPVYGEGLDEPEVTEAISEILSSDESNIPEPGIATAETAALETETPTDTGENKSGEGETLIVSGSETESQQQPGGSLQTQQQSKQESQQESEQESEQFSTPETAQASEEPSEFQTGIAPPETAVMTSYVTSPGLYSLMSVSALSAQSTNNYYLKNGGFEDYTVPGSYIQVTQDEAYYWLTTAFQKKIELFKENTGVYIKGVTLTPSEGINAAELNADEASSLYQIVDTMPNTIYKWGLDHRGRLGNDTMALVIGPAQENAPAKPDKNGKDQYMQMVDWANEKGLINLESFGSGTIQEFNIYSKKFGPNGTFLNNDDGYPFSNKADTTYTEEWKVWVMMSGNDAWVSYGSNAGSIAEVIQDSYYTVPEGQTQTIFAFTAVKGIDNESAVASDPTKKNTYGNFLDNINFSLHQPLSGSSTMHGSGNLVIGDETVGVRYEDSYAKYVLDGTSLTIKAIIAKDDRMDEEGNGVAFAGVIYTVASEEGTSVQTFLPSSDPDWTVETDAEGNLVYSRSMSGIRNATNLHFVFIRSPVITYDTNGGKAYVCSVSESGEELSYFSFAPSISENAEVNFVAPFTSYTAQGQDPETWLFTGWQVLDDEGLVASENGTPLLLNGEHTVACNYNMNISTTEKKQLFQVVNSPDGFTDGGKTEYEQTWRPVSEPVYQKAAYGLTLIAQWRWRQRFLPMSFEGGTYVNSSRGGTLVIPSGAGTPVSGTLTGVDYFAQTSEKVSCQAVPATGYTFDGWYDSPVDGKLVSVNPTLTYTEQKESVNTYYARFSSQYTQTFIREFQQPDDTFVRASDDDATLAPVLSVTSHVDAYGSRASSTAYLSDAYAFLGWFDADGNPVSEEMLTNSGMTISYLTSGNATYYARYAPSLSVTVRKLVDGNMGDKTNQPFQFSISVTTAEGNPAVFEVSGVSSQNGTASFTLKHGKSIEVEGLPLGAAVTVQETDCPSGYVTTWSLDGGTAVSGKTASISSLTGDSEITFTNTKEVPPDVGVATPASMPYAAILLVAALILLTLSITKRKYEDE